MILHVDVLSILAWPSNVVVEYSKILIYATS